MRWALGVLVITACGTDVVPGGSNDIDAPPQGTPSVTITSPAKATSFYVTDTIAIEWTVQDDGPSVTCDVTAMSTGSPIAIMSDVTVSSGQSGSVSWSLSGVAPANYNISVTCADATPLSGVGTSGDFTIAPPPQTISFASQVVPIFGGSCTNTQCHDSVQSQESLDLTAAKAYAELVGVSAKQCSATQLVNAGAPNESYLVLKLQGSGPCFKGVKMPKLPFTVTPAQIQQIRDWIQNGAPNN